MATWSGMRAKLEKEYLADSLKGRIQYFATTYKKSHDQMGRAAILFDGREIISGCFYNNWLKKSEFPHDEKYDLRTRYQFAFMDDTAVRLGIFDESCFYKAFEEFDNQSIENSLQSDNMLVRIMAILDRRTGKRRLAKIRETIAEQEPVFREFFAIRAEAEGI